MHGFPRACPPPPCMPPPCMSPHACRVGMTEPIGRDGCVAATDAVLGYFGIYGTVGGKVG